MPKRSWRRMQSSIAAEELQDDPAFKVALAMTLLIWALGVPGPRPACGLGALVQVGAGTKTKAARRGEHHRAHQCRVSEAGHRPPPEKHIPQPNRGCGPCQG